MVLKARVFKYWSIILISKLSDVPKCALLSRWVPHASSRYNPSTSAPPSFLKRSSATEQKSATLHSDQIQRLRHLPLYQTELNRRKIPPCSELFGFIQVKAFSTTPVKIHQPCRILSPFQSPPLGQIEKPVQLDRIHNSHLRAQHIDSVGSVGSSVVFVRMRQGDTPDADFKKFIRKSKQFGRDGHVQTDKFQRVSDLWMATGASYTDQQKKEWKKCSGCVVQSLYKHLS